MTRRVHVYLPIRSSRTWPAFRSLAPLIAILALLILIAAAPLTWA